MDKFENIVKEVERVIDEIPYTYINIDNEDVRLFQTLNNKRLTELGETYDEYKIRQKISRKLIKEWKSR
jgi:hypothetical protein